MKTASLILALAFAAALNAQTAPSGNPMVSESRQAYNQIKTNLIAMAEKMPPEGYDFKPTPEMRTFGALMAHIADAQTRTCSAVNGAPKTPDAGSKTSKADLVAALKASFAECDAAWDGTTEANAVSMIAAGRGQRSRLSVLIGTTIIHNNEEYGYGSPYLRLKSVVPPSSDRGSMGGKKQ